MASNDKPEIHTLISEVPGHMVQGRYECSCGAVTTGKQKFWRHRASKNKALRERQELDDYWDTIQ